MWRSRPRFMSRQFVCWLLFFIPLSFAICINDRVENEARGQAFQGSKRDDSNNRATTAPSKGPNAWTRRWSMRKHILHKTNLQERRDASSSTTASTTTASSDPARPQA